VATGRGHAKPDEKMPKKAKQLILACFGKGWGPKMSMSMSMSRGSCQTRIRKMQRTTNSLPPQAG